MRPLTRAADGPVTNVLSIAGSDPSGGAGIQADLKTFAALGAYGMAAITALTAQNTCGVRAAATVDPAFLGDQIDAVFDDIRVDAVKIGMAGSAASVARIADCLRRHRPPIVVLDPVMVAKSGHRLIDDAAIAALRDELVPLATVLTPNVPEAGVLLDQAPPDETGFDAAAAALRALGSNWVLLKGGHLRGATCRDVLVGPAGDVSLESGRSATANTHGTGCTLSSAVAALLPVAPDAVSAVRGAKLYLGRAIAAAEGEAIGAGHGPVSHFHALWQAHPGRALLAEVASA